MCFRALPKIIDGTTVLSQRTRKRPWRLISTTFRDSRHNANSPYTILRAYVPPVPLMTRARSPASHPGCSPGYLLPPVSFEFAYRPLERPLAGPGYRLPTVSAFSLVKMSVWLLQQPKSLQSDAYSRPSQTEPVRFRVGQGTQV